jgi:predicted MPP superfamily phosphohydrolase
MQRRRQLAPAHSITGNERRRINPNRGMIKVIERKLDIALSRFLYPRLYRIWNPYSWLVERRFTLAETRVTPSGWPLDLAPLRVLLITDIHAGIFLKPETLAEIVLALMEHKPDLVALGGDLVTGHAHEVKPILGALAPLSAAPLGAWFCYGNHDYFDGAPEIIQRDLAAIGIRTLRNESVQLQYGNSRFVLGGIDDLILGKPDWQRLCAQHGEPHLLLAHNPDHFYQAVVHTVPLTLAGHTHGGQIRFPNGPPLIRQSRYCLDEGIYAFDSSLLIVSRGLGSVLVPWRWGADPEAILIEIVPPQ